MGYTHYWRVNKAFTDAQWSAIIADINKILGVTRVPLRREYDEPGTKPEVNSQQVFFNGAGDNGHETFVLNKDPIRFQFCKTARKPYDQVVCACLIVAAKHAPDAIKVSSDGSPEEWQPGLTLVTAACGPNYLVPLKKDEEDC